MPIPTGFAQANMIYTGAGVPTGAQWTLGIDPAGGDPIDVATLVATAITSAGIMTHFTEEVSITSVMVKFGPDATGPSGTLGVDLAGTVTGESLPPNVCVLVRKNTALGGRAGRGRLYLPSVPEAEVNEAGELVEAYMDGVQTAFDEFFDELGSLAVPGVLLHGAGSPLSVPTPLTSFSVQAVCATQRRRLRR